MIDSARLRDLLPLRLVVTEITQALSVFFSFAKTLLLLTNLSFLLPMLASLVGSDTDSAALLDLLERAFVCNGISADT